MKNASRYLLPLELFMAVLMLSWGVSGWLGGGILWNVLAAAGTNTEWGLSLCLVGLAQLLASGAEWGLGRRWGERALLYSVSVRFWIALVSVAVWIYVCKVMLTLPGGLEVFALLVQAPAALLFAAWIGIGNRKMACLLDPAVPTVKLQRQILEERRWNEDGRPVRFGPP
jgi:hypothetical protein